MQGKEKRLQMFGFLKKKKDVSLYAPVGGRCMELKDVPDKVFSTGMMGQGFAIQPDEDVIGAPVNGEITMIFPTGHAFGMKSADGKEILVHIGLDTVNLKGKGFSVLKQVHDTVKAGEPVIRFDRERIEQSCSSTTMVLVTNREEGIPPVQNLGCHVQKNELIVAYE